MTTPRPRPASVTVMDSQSAPNTTDGTRWYSKAKPVTVHTLDDRLTRIEALLERLVGEKQNEEEYSHGLG
jgi:hypothetical protein